MKYKPLVILFIFVPTYAFAAISFDGNGKWETTYDCAEWEHDWIDGDPLNCDGLGTGGNWATADGSVEQVTSAANNTSGGGGRGQRHWQGDGNSGENDNSGGLSIDFPSGLSEFWIRIYIRYELGFAWVSSSPHYDKLLYVDATHTENIIAGLVGNEASLYISSPGAHNLSTGSKGWSGMMGGSTGDGQWHSMEWHVKADTNNTDGEIRIWVDGELALEVTDANFYGTNAEWNNILIGSNQNQVATGPDSALDFDDVVIYNQTPPNTDDDGNAFIGTLGSPSPVNGVCGSNDGASLSSLTSGDANNCSVGSVSSFSGTGPWTWNCDGSGGGTNDSCSASLSSGPTDPTTGLTKGTEIVSESFESDSWSSRDWYDGTNSTGTESGGYSSNALKWTWSSTSTQPTGFSAIRQVMDQAVDEFLIEYYIKYDTGWQGSGEVYHPHLIHVLSSEDTAYQGFAGSNSNLYFEAVADVTSPYNNYPHIAHQDLVRAVSSTSDLTDVTETRSANECDTPYEETGATTGTCYSSGGWYSANTWKSSSVTIPGNEWAKITAYIKMNTFTTGTGNFDGIMKLWVNSDLAIESNTVLYAAGAHEGSAWDKIALSPWIGDGSPINQSMWLDELSVWTIASVGGGAGKAPYAASGRAGYSAASSAGYVE